MMLRDCVSDLAWVMTHLSAAVRNHNQNFSLERVDDEEQSGWTSENFQYLISIDFCRSLSLSLPGADERTHEIMFLRWCRSRSEDDAGINGPASENIYDTLDSKHVRFHLSRFAINKQRRCWVDCGENKNRHETDVIEEPFLAWIIQRRMRRNSVDDDGRARVLAGTQRVKVDLRSHAHTLIRIIYLR